MQILLTFEMSKDEEAILKKLDLIIQDQEMFIKKLDILSQEEKNNTIEEVLKRTLQQINNSQMSIIEKVNNLQTKLDKISANYSRLHYEQKELKTEMTNKTFLQNELSKDLEKLKSFVKSGRSPAKLISSKLDDFAKELFVVGVHQNVFQTSLDEFKVKLTSEIRKMSMDLIETTDRKSYLSNEQQTILMNKIEKLDQ